MKLELRARQSSGGTRSGVHWLLAVTAIAGAVPVLSVAVSTGSSHADSVNWEAIAQCESGGNWAANTGNGLYGGLQISEPTWQGNGGAGLPSTTNADGQIEVADRIMATQGPGAWPRCSACSRGEAPAGSLTHILTALMASSGGCMGNNDD
ncbi:Resuscitation-promoting factor RpfD [Mycobacterium simulans]|uniref:Resuscitation-promoting factor RpfD n=1 Tax=Mycobacterium simulans TaxID=627089 RepID=A0A7Z7NAX6_9MYCO|nr:transglycosylase family protein [Mycobacterium simulans]SOJ56184.1 Resuscitation-promoting factor RpfD [Mycobacterium simulans]